MTICPDCKQEIKDSEAHECPKQKATPKPTSDPRQATPQNKEVRPL